MNVSSEFQDNVKIGDVLRVRSALLDYLIEKNYEGFDDSLEYAKQFIAVIQKYDKKPFEEDSSKWDIDYLNKQKVDLMINFSQERIEHLKKVINIVLVSKQPESSTDFNPESTNSVTSQSKKQTGRRKISETEIPGSQCERESNCSGTHKSSDNKTGRRVVSEREIQKSTQNEKNKKCCDKMIIGGVVVAAVGLITVKPIIIGAGVVLAGIGYTRGK
jgi:hypothetical protein